MKPHFVAASLFAAALTIVTVPAMAADDSAACHALANQTRTALTAASGDVSQAREEATAGMQSCNFGLFKNGADHYRKALSLLGK